MYLKKYIHILKIIKIYDLFFKCPLYMRYTCGILIRNCLESKNKIFQKVDFVRYSIANDYKSLLANINNLYILLANNLCDFIFHKIFNEKLNRI